MSAAEPAGFTRVLSEDFTTDPGFEKYDAPAVDTDGDGTYSAAAITVANGMMQYNLSGNTAAAAVPGGYGGQTYGRYTVRWRVESGGEGYKNAWLLWPSSDNWNEGEINHPEGGLTGGTLKAFNHCVGNPEENCANFDSGLGASEWRTDTIEWTPQAIRFLTNGRVIGETNTSIPSTPFRWTMQTEVAGATQPTRIVVDWLTIGSYGGDGEVVPENTPTTTMTPEPAPSPSLTSGPADPTGENEPEASDPEPSTTATSPGQEEETPQEGAPAEPSGGDASLSALEQQVVVLTNQERAKAGVNPPYVTDTCLSEAAQAQADRQAAEGNMHHNPQLRDVMSQCGLQAVSENVATGQDTAERVVADWMASTEGHREAILSTTSTKIGVGLAYGSDGKPYWAQVFNGAPAE